MALPEVGLLGRVDDRFVVLVDRPHWGVELDALREQFGGTVEGEAVQHGGGRGVVGQLGCAHVSSGASGHRAARALSSTIRERPSEARELHTTSCEGATAVSVRHRRLRCRGYRDRRADPGSRRRDRCDATDPRASRRSGLRFHG